jgi:hypothetical protein
MATPVGSENPQLVTMVLPLYGSSASGMSRMVYDAVWKVNGPTVAVPAVCACAGAGRMAPWKTNAMARAMATSGPP